ncbi:MAG: T9SS type A sorting domain-containing protein, partial [Saprospiraceae bacterium]
VNGSTTFRIRYRPTSAGCHYATISIPSNDPDPARSTYTFTVFGKSGASCPDNAPSPTDTDQEFSLADGFDVAISTGNEDIAPSPRGLENIASEMTLYPNPATDRVLMEVPVSEESQLISFINVSGITVYSMNTKGGFYNIDLAGFDPGVYFVGSSDRTRPPKPLVKM